MNSFLLHHEQLYYLLDMISKCRLISREQAARKFNCSKFTIQRMINELRLMDHDIRYSRTRGRYVMHKPEE